MCKQYLVTGGASQLGEHLVKMLLEKGNKVRILIGPDDDESIFDGLDVEIFRGETFLKDTMKEFFAVENPRECILVHADERVSLANSVASPIKVERFILCLLNFLYYVPKFMIQSEITFLLTSLYPITTAQTYIQVFGIISIPIIGLTSDHSTTGI